MSEGTSGPITNRDLNGRIDRLEARQETQAKDLGALAATVERVELNQEHAEELNKLRFDSLGQAVNQIGGKLDAFMGRIESIISGEVELPQQRQGQAMVTEYMAWRKTVDAELDTNETFRTQAQTITRIVLIILGTGWLGTAIALYNVLTK